MYKWRVYGDGEFMRLGGLWRWIDEVVDVERDGDVDRWDADGTQCKQRNMHR